MAAWEMTDLTEGWEPHVHQAEIGGRLVDILSATRTQNVTDPPMVVLDETFIWMPRVA